MAAVRYLVKDVDKSIKFYTDLLGFKLEQQFGLAMAIVSKNDFKLWLAGLVSSAAQAMPDGSKPVPGGSQILCEEPSGNLIELFEG